MARINETPEMTATRLRYAEAAKAWAEAVLANPEWEAAGDALDWPMRRAQIDYQRACLKARIGDLAMRSVEITADPARMTPLVVDGDEVRPVHGGVIRHG